MFLNTHEKVVIISQARKATDKTKYWFKIKNIDIGSITSVHFSKVKDWEYLEEVLMNNTAESDNSNEILKGYHR